MIQKLHLVNFKKHLNLKIDIDCENLVLIYGSNGSGKTSILESIALFSPGKGLFNKNYENFANLEKNFWQVNLNNANIDYFNEKKEIKINNSITRPIELLEWWRIYGLTPYISLAFWKDQAIKRRHIDRLILQHEPSYGIYIAKYEKAVRERNKLIESNFAHSKSWLKSLEEIIIEHGVKIIEFRRKILLKISHTKKIIREFVGGNIKIEMQGDAEGIKDLEQIKPFWQQSFRNNNFQGPHRTKFILSTSDLAEDKASTGEQRRMLLGLVLEGLPKMQINNILLLDDSLSHLDHETQVNFLKILKKSHFQTWISHTTDLPIEAKKINL